LSENTALHDTIKQLIVETLVLEDVTPAEIKTDAPLFGEGLGLDSIDSLEIAMVLEERFGLTLDDDPDTNREIFHSIGSLASFVAENRVR
jgi:acyl carrier protein